MPVEKATSCQQARTQKVTEFTPQQWEQRAHRLIVISFVVSLCAYFCLLTSLFPLLWCKFCNLLCACLLANGCFLHQHSKQKNHTRHTETRGGHSYTSHRTVRDRGQDAGQEVKPLFSASQTVKATFGGRSTIKTNNQAAIINC